MNVYLRKQNLLWQKILVRAGAVVLLIIAMNLFQGPLKSFYYTISSPISSIFLKAGSNSANFFTSLINFKGLQRENSNLKRENQQLLTALSMLENHVSQTYALQGALETTKGEQFSLQPAQVTGFDLVNGLITINIGSNEGVKENMPVISQEKALYGKVTKAYATFSEVMLISSKKSVVDVKIQHAGAESSVHGAIKGEGGNGVYLDLVSSDAQINEGDIIITSALEGIFPQNLLVGKITSVSKNDSKAFQNAKIQPFFDVKSADALFVITNYKQ